MVYNELVQTHYSDEYNHLFISEMRNNLSHVILHRPDWQISKDFKSNKQEVGYFFDARYLFYRGSWKSKKFKSYLQSSEKIDCYEEMLKYFKATNKFLDNLFKYDQENLSAAEIHFKTSLGLREGMHLKSSIGLWKQVLSNRPEIDPYKHLNKYFSENEIRLIMKRERHSKQQVDLMIEIGDKWGVCDEHTRQSIYEIFKVEQD